jgi:hypothetical protein
MSDKKSTSYEFVDSPSQVQMQSPVLEQTQAMKKEVKLWNHNTTSNLFPDSN